MIIYDILLILQYQVNYCDGLGRCFRFVCIYTAVFFYYRWIKIYIKAYHLAKRSSQVPKVKRIFLAANINSFCKQSSQANGSKNVITGTRDNLSKPRPFKQIRKTEKMKHASNSCIDNNLFALVNIWLTLFVSCPIIQFFVDTYFCFFSIFIVCFRVGFFLFLPERCSAADETHKIAKLCTFE